MSFEIQEKSGLWTAIHAQGRCGGPRSISIGENLILSGMSCAIDGQNDDMVHSKSSRVYHKGGMSVFESKGVFLGGQTLNQICRYAGNCVRITWDLSWPKETPVKDKVEIGSVKLHGNWKRVYVIPYGESLDVVPGCWQELVPGKNMGWANCPLCLVFEREDGVRMEYSLGFDLWRWNYGIGLQDGTSLEIEVEEDVLQLSRYLAKDMPEDGLIPEARDYRFMASIAWSSPEMLSTITPAPDKVVDLSINPKRGLDLSGLGEVESKSLALRFKYDDLPCPDSERRRDADGKTGKPCLETGNAISSLKRYIRQLAAIGANGGYLAIDGLTPGLCFVGSHCDKKSNRIHWDLQDILTFAAWAKNCLGDDWTLEFPQPEGWCELPSLAGMGLPNGFVYA